MNRSFFLRHFIAVLLLAAFLSSCQTVSQLERAALADYTMRPDRDPSGDALTEHLYFSREASHGGKGIGVSGCGCN